MENPEEILQCLEEFSKIKPKDIPRELEEYLCFVAKTGNPVYQWPVIKCLFRQKLINVISDFYETCPAVDIPPCLNVDLFNYNTMKTFILEKLDTFVAAPFTVQRICELLTTPRKQYNRIDKYMRALEKNILVVSTTEPVYRSTENGDNNNQAVVNGLESDHMSSASSDDTPNINIEEMDDTPPQNPNWLPQTNRNAITITHNTQQQSQPSEDDSLGEEPPGERESTARGHVAEAVLEPPASVNTVVVVEATAVNAAGDGGFGSGGSSDEDEEEERLLLAGEGTEKEEDEDQQDKSEQQLSSPIDAKSAPIASTDTVAVIDNSESSTELPIITTTATIAPPAEIDEVAQQATDQVSTEIERIDSGDRSLQLESGAMLVAERELVDEELKEGGKDGDSDSMSDKINTNPQVNIEYVTEINKEPPNTENTEALRKIPETVISTETSEVTSDNLPEETTISETTDNVNINIEPSSDHAKLDINTPENSEIMDKEIDIEKHDTSTIVKEAEKLEKEVTQMENIPEVELAGKGDEKQIENVEKIQEIVANIEEVANLENNENNVEQDERMEVDDDALPDILEATSASL